MYTHTHCNTATATYSEHVLRGHRYRKPGADMEPEPLNARRMDMEDSDPSALGDSDSPVFEKFNPVLLLPLLLLVVVVVVKRGLSYCAKPF
jgi:hypothetical protein